MATTTNKTYKTLVIKGGEKALLPSSAIVQSVILDGTVSVESSCGVLPTPSAYKCGYFLYVRDNDADDGHPMDENRLKIGKLYIGGAEYIIDLSANVPTVNDLNAKIPNLSLFQFMQVNNPATYTKRKYFALYFKVPEALFSDLRLEMDENGIAKFLVAPVEYDCGQYDFSF